MKFVDMWPDFVPDNNFWYNFLSRFYKIELSDKPDYLFYSVFGDRHLKHDCIKIFQTGENQYPDFNLCYYAIAFAPLEYGDRYLRFPLYYLYDVHFDMMLAKTVFSAADLADKTEFCSCFNLFI